MAVATHAGNISKPWCDLHDKVVMVTGASSGLGWEFCVDLAKAGCKIIAAARRIDRLKTLCDKINQFGESNKSETISELQAVAVELDVSADGPAIEASVKKAWEAFGHIDALINNAGLRGPIQSSLDLSEEVWDTTFRTNLTGAWLVSKYVALRMRAANRGGTIINISSIDGLNHGHSPGALAYSSSKAALNTMTKVMAMELGKYGIRVNVICPGIFKSEITKSLVQKEWLKTVAWRTVALRKFGTTDPALTSLLRYLIHGSSGYVTGNVFTVDSGTSLTGVPIFSSL